MSRSASDPGCRAESEAGTGNGRALVVSAVWLNPATPATPHAVGAGWVTRSLSHITEEWGKLSRAPAATEASSSTSGQPMVLPTAAHVMARYHHGLASFTQSAVRNLVLVEKAVHVGSSWNLSFRLFCGGCAPAHPLGVVPQIRAGCAASW